MPTWNDLLRRQVKCAVALAGMLGPAEDVAGALRALRRDVAALRSELGRLRAAEAADAAAGVLDRLREARALQDQVRCRVYEVSA